MSTPTLNFPTLAPIDGAPTIAEDSLQAIEQKYSCQLPDDYRKFLLENNGGFPSPDCVNFEEAGQKTASDVFCFFAIGEKRAWASMEWHRDTCSGRLPKNTLPIARDSCGNLWLLSVGGDNVGSISFWDHGSYDTLDETDLRNWPCVATSFTEFLGNLGSHDAIVETTLVPSRYSLVNQATAGMAKNHAGFTARANPGFVWHCDCDDEGNVTMEFVRYDVHAAVTHTDGYSRLRAMKGLIKEGPTRLPEKNVRTTSHRCRTLDARVTSAVAVSSGHRFVQGNPIDLPKPSPLRFRAMRRALKALFVLSTVAAVLVPPAAAGVVLLPGCHKSDKGHGCACCRSGETTTHACCQEQSGDRPRIHQNDCGSCPLGHCCGCCAVGAPTMVPSGTSVIAAPALATPLAVSTERLTTRSDEPLLPPPIA